MPAMQHFLSEIWKKRNGEAMNTNVDYASHELDTSKFESKLSILYLLWPFENCSNRMNCESVLLSSLMLTIKQS